jgi:hypothetical protein
MEQRMPDLPPEQIARLLALSAAKPDENEGGPAACERAFRDTLSSELRLDASVSNSIPVTLGRACEQLERHRGRSLGAVLLDPTVDVASLGCLKDYGKESVRRSVSQEDQAAGTMIYYAAIAAALVFRGEKISQHGYARLARAFGLLVGKVSGVPELVELLTKAQRLCQDRASEDPQAKAAPQP